VAVDGLDDEVAERREGEADTDSQQGGRDQQIVGVAVGEAQQGE
jgi:hypothetical protein